MTAPSMPEVYAQKGWGAHEVAPAVSGWGDAIQVNGVRPSWLPDDVEVMAYELDGREFTQAYPARLIYWPNQTKFALPVPRYDFVYLALSKGMVPWFGNGKPDLWDHGVVLIRSGEEYELIYGLGSDLWEHVGTNSDIIGYRAALPLALPLAHPAAPQGEEGENERLRAALRACRKAVSHGSQEPRRNVREIVDRALEVADRAALAPAAIASGRGGAE